jgi:hypothetical protein
MRRRNFGYWDKVLAAFLEIVADDPYLRTQWGGLNANPVSIRELL